MKCYLAGPMTGIPQFNFPAFDQAAHVLRAAGWEVLSPAEMDISSSRAAALASPDGAPGSGSSSGETWGDFLARDVKLIADVKLDAVFVLPGWDESRGALLETFVAAALKRIPVLALDGEPISASTLLMAWGKRLIRTKQDWIGPDGVNPWTGV